MISQRRLVRVMDANINRAREGLRVCEDVVRFCLGNAAQTRAVRTLRHALNAQIQRLPITPAEAAFARDSRRDPGRRARSSSITSIEHLLLINLQRTKEALRVLEESSRLLAPVQTRGFQRLRFRTYDVERDLLVCLATLRHHRPSRRRRP